MTAEVVGFWLVGAVLVIAGVALIAASLFFKASVFPFHLWVPDVYQGSPTPITAFMATGTKAAAFAFLLNATFLLPSSATPSARWTRTTSRPSV